MPLKYWDSRNDSIASPMRRMGYACSPVELFARRQSTQDQSLTSFFFVGTLRAAHEELEDMQREFISCRLRYVSLG